jgi:hypothetical protein
VQCRNPGNAYLKSGPVWGPDLIPIEFDGKSYRYLFSTIFPRDIITTRSICISTFGGNDVNSVLLNGSPCVRLTIDLRSPIYNFSRSFTLRRAKNDTMEFCKKQFPIFRRNVKNNYKTLARRRIYKPYWKQCSRKVATGCMKK